MKLIKLSSTTSGEFENVFNVDIPVSPKSQVGLVSASVVLSSKNITIDDTNNLFEMRTQQTQGTPATPRAYYNVNLTNGDYTKPSFLIELNRALNTALNNDTESTACIEWRTGLDDDKLQLEMRRGKFDVDVKEDDLSVMKNLTYATAAKTYTKTGSENWEGFGVSKGLFVNGCGEAGVVVAFTSSKYALGLVENPPNDSATSFGVSDYAYVVYTQTGSANYLISSASGVVDSGVAPVHGDNVIIELTEGTLKFVRKQGGVDTTIHTFNDWTFKKHYHLGFNVLTGVISNITWAPSPFTESVNGVHIYRNTPIQDTILFDPQLAQSTAPTRGIASITFKTKPSTGTYMGFHNDEYTMSSAGYNWTLDADEELSESVSFTDLLVELPNLTMESYDGGAGFGKRRPVVAYLPSLEVQNSEFVYNAINPVMIDLNNAFKFNLNRVQVRLLTSSPQIVKIESATIVILIG